MSSDDFSPETKPSRIGKTADSTHATRSAINAADFAAHFSSMPELARPTAERFIQTCPSLIEELKRAVIAQDTSSIHRAAHKIKGSVAYFYAQNAQELSVRIEHQAQLGNSTDLSELCGHLILEVEQIVRELQLWMQSTTDGIDPDPSKQNTKT